MILNNKNVFAQLLFFLGIWLLCLGFLAIASLVVAAKCGVNFSDVAGLLKAKNTAILPFIKWVLIIQSLLFFILPPLVFAFLIHKNGFKYLGLVLPKIAWHWVAGVALLILAMPFVGLLGQLNEAILPNSFKLASQDYKDQIDFLLADMRQTKSLVFMLFTAGLLAGLGEELLFRGVLQNLFIKITKSPWAGIIVIALFFSAFHMEFTAFLPRFALGVLLGIAYWYTGSLWVSILGHTIFNVASIIGMYYNVAVESVAASNQNLALIISGVISLIIVVFLVRALIKTSLTNYKEVYGIAKVSSSNFDNYFKK